MSTAPKLGRSAGDGRRDDSLHENFRSVDPIADAQFELLTGKAGLTSYATYVSQRSLLPDGKQL